MQLFPGWVPLPWKSGRKPLFGEVYSGSEADASKAGVKIWPSRAGTISSAERMVPARRALPALEPPPVLAAGLGGQQGQVGHGGRQVQLEFRLGAPEVAGLADSQLDQPRQPVLHHHPALPVLGEGLALLQGPSLLQ